MQKFSMIAIHSSHRNRRTKAIAEALAMIADAHPELAPHHPRPVRETDEWLWESATEFCAAPRRLFQFLRRRQPVPVWTLHYWTDSSQPNKPIGITARRPCSF
jgi:hypothetical protein